jgi:ABC-type sugar transport system permease subunit
LFWVLIAPALLLYTVVFLLPIVLTVRESLFSGPGASRVYVGLANYSRALQDPLFRTVLKNTGEFAVISAAMLFIPGLLYAWCLTQSIRFKRFFRAIVFAPVIMSVLVAAILWKFLLNPNWGLVNNALRSIGLDDLAFTWLGDSRTAMLAIAAAASWQALGLWVVLMSAGLERIPQDLTDAGMVDGSGEWQQFWRIRMPLMWDVFRNLLILYLLQASQSFAFVFVMTNGGPANRTEIAATYIYNIAFVGRDTGYATALATIVLLISIGITVILLRVMRSETYEF